MMTIFVMECVPSGLRGELTRWMLELRTGVFVGMITPMVRDRLWDRIIKKLGIGGCVMVFRADTEQGFAFEVAGEPSREIVDFDGLQLVRILTL